MIFDSKYSEIVTNALSDYKTGDRSLELNSERKKRYNAIYYDVFSNHPMIHNRNDLELQLTSVIDFMEYEFCGEHARGHFDHFGSLKLRPKALSQLRTYIEDTESTDSTIKMLNELYMESYVNIANRYNSFYDRVQKTGTVPKFMIDAKILLDRNIQKIKSS